MAETTRKLMALGPIRLEQDQTTAQLQVQKVRAHPGMRRDGCGLGLEGVGFTLEKLLGLVALGEMQHLSLVSKREKKNEGEKGFRERKCLVSK